ncbi:fungal-specific transcription factor domain-containing protein [Delphinella strobiligena]|nr:fungal-specific transcription factor domain-containing protein [Delphinella strobiligena]
MTRYSNSRVVFRKRHTRKSHRVAPHHQRADRAKTGRVVSISSQKQKRKSSREPPRKLKPSSGPCSTSTGIDEYDEYQGQTILRKTLGLMNKHHAHYVGLTEPFSFPRFTLPVGSNQKNVQGGQVTVRKVEAETIFTVHEDQGTVGYDTEASRRDAVQEIVGPHGPELVDLYFRGVHPSFPILHRAVYLEKYERSLHEFTAASLGAVYLLASSYWAYSPKLVNAPKPDIQRLWNITLESFQYTIFRPKLSSVQAGLLLAQYEGTDGGTVSSGSRGKLTAHLTSIAHKVGLHLDPGDWDIPAWEISLRRRLAWALYMQDKWLALVEGRPTQISNINWAVEMCYLRLTYLALEGSIHRRIICETSSLDVEPHLLSVCLKAARARLFSALDFVNGLKAQHLTSFWYFSSSPCLTLLISFGNLLLGSSADPEERQFYVTKLKEFRWTLKLNGEAGAKFMKPGLAAMVVDPDDLWMRQQREFNADSVGQSPATALSGASYNVSPRIGIDGLALAGPSMSCTGGATTPMTSWQGASPHPGFEEFFSGPIPDMQEYLNAFAWMPPHFDSDWKQFPGVN